jgi:hypothetical protein
MALWHVVLISYQRGTPESVQEDLYNRYQTLAEDCGGTDAGILLWKVEKNLDLRNGVQLVEVSQFADDEALQRFRVHPKHMEVTNLLRECANWQVGDIPV